MDGQTDEQMEVFTIFPSLKHGDEKIYLDTILPSAMIFTKHKLNPCPAEPG